MFKSIFGFLQKDGKSPAEDAAQPKASTSGADSVHAASPEQLEALRTSLGGVDNIVSAEPAAMTRLLITLKDRSLVKAELAELSGIFLLVPSKSDRIQAVVGLQPERFSGLV